MNATPRALRLSDAGGDRATAYAMSTKVLRLKDRLLITWIDVERVNRFAVVRADDDRIIDAGPIGDARPDNHCGAALAQGPDGTLHALLGGHHTPLDHYIAEPGDRLAWRHVGRIDEPATYPALVALPDATLLAAFRCRTEPTWSLHLATRQGDGPWRSRALLHADVPGYVYFTNTLDVAADQTVHLATGVTTRVGDAYVYSAAHLASTDAGRTWRQPGDDQPIAEPCSVRELQPIDAADPEPPPRFPVDRLDEQPRGPRHSNYLHINLSNLVTGPRGQPTLILHNALERDAKLRRWDGTTWVATPLFEAVRQAMPGHRIHLQSSLSIADDASLFAAVMVSPENQPGWGPDSTETLGVHLGADGELRRIEPLLAPDAEQAQWLLSLERRWTVAAGRPACVLTRGTNAGGFDHNQNATASEVWLVR